MQSQLVARLTFAALVAATLAAFFVAQRLKRTEPLVNRVHVSRYLSPNSDGEKERARLSFIVKRTDSVTALIVDQEDRQVRRLRTDVRLTKGFHVLHWDGLADSGSKAPDGVYYLRVGLRNQGRVATSAKKIMLDTRPPRPFIVSVKPDLIRPGSKSGAGAKIRYAGPINYRPQFLAYRIGRFGPRLVTSFRGDRGSERAVWHGFLRSGKAVPPGRYLIAVRVRDAAGNLATSSLSQSKKGSHPELTVRKKRRAKRK